VTLIWIQQLTFLFRMLCNQQVRWFAYEKLQLPADCGRVQGKCGTKGPVSVLTRAHNNFRNELLLPILPGSLSQPTASARSHTPAPTDRGRKLLRRLRFWVGCIMNAAGSCGCIASSQSFCAAEWIDVGAFLQRGWRLRTDHDRGSDWLPAPAGNTGIQICAAR
jgi:hypothetical protein